MKRRLAITILLTLLLSLAACSEKPPSAAFPGGVVARTEEPSASPEETAPAVKTESETQTPDATESAEREPDAAQMEQKTPDEPYGGAEILTWDGEPLSASDQEVLDLAFGAVEMMKNQDWGALGSLVHPAQGVTFSPWGYVDIDRCVKLGMGDVKALGEDDTVRVWGDWPSDEPMKYTFGQYYAQFIFDRDYTQAAQIGINHIVKNSGFEDNMYVFGNGGAYVEFYVPGSGEDAEYNWGSLRLVFAWFDGDDAHESGLYLVGIIHDGWSP